jgi:hypothetical protein
LEHFLAKWVFVLNREIKNNVVMRHNLKEIASDILPFLIVSILVMGTIYLFWPEPDPYEQDRERIFGASDIHYSLIQDGLDPGFSVDRLHIVYSEFESQIYTGGLINGTLLNNIFGCWIIDKETENVYSVDFIASEYSGFISAADAGFEVHYPNEECGILAYFLE